MNIVKSVLRNKMGDEFMSDCLICYVEKDIFSTITNDDVIDLFKKMKDREGKLWNVSLVSLYFLLNDTYFLHYFFLTIVVNLICYFVHPFQKVKNETFEVILLPIISGICKEVLFYALLSQYLLLGTIFLM